MAESLRLQIDTSQAQKALKDMEASLKQLDEAMKKFGGSGIDKAAASMEKIKISPKATASVNKLNESIKKVDASAKHAGTSMKFKTTFARNTTAAMKLNNVLVSTTSHAKQAGAALAFKGAASGIAATTAAVATLNSNLAVTKGAALGLGKGFKSLKTAAAGFGVVIGGMAIKQFAEASLSAVNTFQGFTNTFEAVHESAALAAEEWEYVNKVAKETATPVQDAANSYRKFAAAARMSDLTAKATQITFKGVATAARVMNLSAEDTKFSFLALEQMISKGKVSMEELRRQLGERIPGAVKIFADSLKVSTSQLEKMVRNGEVGSDAVVKFGAALQEKFGPQLEKALKSTQSQLNLLTTALFDLQLSFGKEFWAQVTPAIKRFREALEMPEILDAAESFGHLTGVVSAFVIDTGTFFVNNLWMIKAALVALTGLGVAKVIMGIGKAIKFMMSFTTASKAAALATTATNVASIGTGAAAAAPKISKLSKVFSALMIPLRAGLAFFGPWGIAIGLVGGAITLFSDELLTWMGVQTKVNKELDTTATAIDGITTAADEREQAANRQANAEAKVAAATKETSVWTDILQTAYDQITTSAADAKTEADNLSEAAAKEADATQKTGVQVENLANSTDKMATATGSAGYKMDNGSRAAWALSRAYRAAAEAARALAAAEGGAISSGGMSGSSSAAQDTREQGSFASGLANTNTLTPSLPGNGIPVTVHPNEAIIPLTSGGAVPIAVSSPTPTAMTASAGATTSTSSSNSNVGSGEKRFNELLTFADKTHRETVLMREDNKQHTVIIHEDLKMLGMFAKDMLNGMVRQIEAITSLRAFMGSMGGGGGSISTGSGGGGVGGGSVGGGGGGSLTVSTNGGKQIITYTDEFGNRRTTQLGTTYSGTWNDMGGYYVNYNTNQVVGRETEMNISFDENGNPVSEKSKDQFIKEANKAMEKYQNTAGIKNFATGSPNVFKDAHGRGAVVGIHENEAVIPLPDGRSVPVDMGGMDMFKRIAQMLDKKHRKDIDFRDGMDRRYSGGDNTGPMVARVPDGGSANTNVTVQKVVIKVEGVQNPEQFRETEDQIMQRFATKMRRTLSTYGSGQDAEDPTRRVGGPGSTPDRGMM